MSSYLNRKVTMVRIPPGQRIPEEPENYNYWHCSHFQEAKQKHKTVHGCWYDQSQKPVMLWLCENCYYDHAYFKHY